MFEVTLIREPKSLIDVQEIVTALLTGNTGHTPLLITCKAAELSVTAEEELPWTLDGEYGGRHVTAEIENVNRIMNMIISRENDG